MSGNTQEPVNDLNEINHLKSQINNLTERIISLENKIEKMESKKITYMA